MKDLNADFFEMLNSCTEPSDVEVAWQEWMRQLGYGRSAIIVLSWQTGRLEALRHSANWATDILRTTLANGITGSNSIGNPLRKSSSFSANHIEAFSLTGKSKEATRFADSGKFIEFSGTSECFYRSCTGTSVSFHWVCRGKRTPIPKARPRDTRDHKIGRQCRRREVHAAHKWDHLLHRKPA